MEQASATGIDPEAVFSTFRRQQQRRPSNLLQCMDEDGNIDAFRYIEYSKQRRMEFLRRADFICKMKSTLRMQQQLHRSASLPGTKGFPGSSSLPNEAFPAPPPAPAVTPEFLCKSLGRRNSTTTSTMDTKNNLVPVPFLGRSASMPFVSSSVAAARQKAAAGAAAHPNAKFRVAKAHPPIAKFKAVPEPSVRRRSLRREEFEAAEALLFGMGRRSSDASGVSPNPKQNKADDLPLRTTEEAGCSVLSVVSTEEETNNSTMLQEDEGVAIQRVK